MSLIADFRRLFKYNELLYTLAWRDIKLRYKQSVMGLLWAVLMPAVIVGAGALVRVAMGTISGTAVTVTDVNSVIVRGLLWSFVLAALRFGTQSLIANANLVTKIAFPREVFPLSAVLSCFADFLVAVLCGLVALLILGWTPSPHALLALPIMLLTFMFVCGVCLILSAANLFYRDVKYVVEILMTFAIFFTPVLYDADLLGKWKSWILLNPVAPLLEALDDVVVRHTYPAEQSWLIYGAVAAVIAFFGGYKFFKLLENQFAERI